VINARVEKHPSRPGWIVRGFDGSMWAVWAQHADRFPYHEGRDEAREHARRANQPPPLMDGPSAISGTMQHLESYRRGA
jgi:hypothetical protein